MAKKPVFDCLVAGEANVDLLVEGPAALEFGKEKLASRMDLVLGGSSSITAFNLASLGTEVAFCGVVGDDEFGRFVESSLRSGSVDISALRRCGEEKTGITIWHTHRGRRAGVTYPGTIALLRAEDVDAIGNARHLHVGAYFLLKNFHSGAIALFHRAKQMGLTTSLDCNYDPEENWDSGIRDLLPYIDFFLPNEDEARAIAGVPNTLAAARRLAGSGTTAVVKCGARGALVCAEGGTPRRVPSPKVRMVDSTGAGDSFNAGFLASFLRGKDLLESVKDAAAAGARCVSRMGGTAAFETAR